MKRALLFMALMACTFASLALAAAGDAPDELVIDNFKAPTNNISVTFNHSPHAQYECKDCHHTWDPACGDPPRPCSFSGCHDVMDKKDKSATSYYKIIHDMRPKELNTCVSCHRELAGADKQKKREFAGCKGSVCHPN